MAVIPLPTRLGRVPRVVLRKSDRFDLPARRDEGHLRFMSLLLGTAIVAGSVVGLLAYDGQRPFAAGAKAAPSIVIPVETR